MQYFFSRRTYNTQKKRFTNNPASVTRYVAMEASAGVPTKGHILSTTDWVDQVLTDTGSDGVLIFVHGLAGLVVLIASMFLT